MRAAVLIGADVLAHGRRHRPDLGHLRCRQSGALDKDETKKFVQILHLLEYINRLLQYGVKPCIRVEFGGL